MIISNSAGSKIIYPEIRISPIQASVRIKNTVKTFLKTCGFTLLSVFIPVLHFILVPVGLLLTATLTYRAFRRNYFIENFEVHCPSCDDVSKHSVGGYDLPLKTICLNCGHVVFLTNEHTRS